MRRCSGESMRNSPPNDHHAWPPSEAAGSCSTMMHALAGVDQFGCGDQPGEAGSDHDDVGFGTG